MNGASSWFLHIARVLRDFHPPFCHGLDRFARRESESCIEPCGVVREFGEADGTVRQGEAGGRRRRRPPLSITKSGTTGPGVPSVRGGEVRVQQEQPQSGPLTVLHVSQPVDGGVARVVADLVRAQTRSGLRTVVACPPHGELAEAAAHRGATVLPWDAEREPGVGLPRETAEAARIVRRTAPDLVHVHSAKAGLAVRLALRGRLPTVFQPHAWSFEAVTGHAARLATGWERWAARWADRVLCVSEDERRRGARAGVDARWAVVHNGVDTGRFSPAGPAEAHRARERLLACSLMPSSMPPGPTAASVPDGPLVVCMGRLCRQKGQDLLLGAWPAVTARVPGARLVLVGDGPSRDGLRAKAPPQVLFAGPATDPALWYEAADLVVAPSRWEGMALAPLEAMACGRPVVLTDVAGARESLPPGHRRTCLVPPEDPEALTEAVVRLLTAPAWSASLGRQARNHVCTNRDVSVTAAAVAALYRELTALPHRDADREELISR
jgi:glycosyltransferase involved in cell wall biosynthesis